ncbi:GlcG/HbpS family heme-binding protein [Sinorhizobium meliloti]|uniref:GlcG/HbpS family heme-binding protein n=1 Tax=Rhizobium meliloti TaxID=382 RepID=UPI00398CEEE5
MRVPAISLAVAKATVAAAEKKAADIGIKATIVILDRGGEQIAMVRMDGTWPGAFDLAVGKAQTARSFYSPSAAFNPSNASAWKYVILPGGLLRRSSGRVPDPLESAGTRAVANAGQRCSRAGGADRRRLSLFRT